MSEIHIYPSLLRTFEGAATQPIECHRVSTGTLREWLLDNVPSYADNPEHNPWEAELDSNRGKVVSPADYEHVQLSECGAIHLYIAPQKGAVNSVFNAVVDVFSSVFSWLMPSMPSDPGSSQVHQGEQLNDPSVTVNRPKLNGVINQIAGQTRVAPYYLAPPHAYFIDRRTKALDVLLCVGWGSYLLPASQMRIAQTPFQALGEAVQWQAFQPGEIIAGHSAHALWYTAPEVGASSSGHAGLELKSVLPVTPQIYASSIRAYGAQLSVSADAAIPLDWEVGMLINVRLPRQVTAYPPPTTEDPEEQTVRAVFSADNSDLGLVVGDAIEITGDVLSGNFVVHSIDGNDMTLSYPDLSPVTSPTAGVYQLSIDREGARYRIVASATQALTVEKLLADGNADTTWLGWPDRTYYGSWSVRIDSSYSESQWVGPFNAQKPGTLATRVEAIVMLPRGLGKSRDDGSMEELTRSVELQWREIGQEFWQWETLEMRDATRDQLGFVVGVDLPRPMAVECRFRRLDAESQDIKIIDEMQWTGLSSRLVNPPTRYDDITVLAVTIIGTDAIAAQSENRITCVPTSIMETMEGTVQPTRAIADWFRNACNQIGIADDDIDMDELQRLHDTWTARGDTFDYNHDGDDTVKAVLERTLQAGFAQLSWEDVLVPVRDEPRTQLGQMYSPQNMRADALLAKSIRSIRPDDYDGVDVEYRSAATDNIETIECRLSPGPAQRVEKIRIDGVTDGTRAWRHGMRRLMWHRYIRKGYSWGTPTDALNSNLGSYCPVVGPIPSKAQSALIEQAVVNADGVHLLSSEPLKWSEIEEHVIYWRKPDGETAGPYPARRGENDYHVIAAMGSDPVPVVAPQKEPPHLLFGQVERVLVKSILPSGMSNVSVEAEGYDERLYQHDDAFPSN
ncbi:host specificity factor TipJ family phage tail protein [Vreelandella populi]|uniref:Tip attachment protein J HDII-ins2 domain-containing protein n=1 Tax=Vreelandella populi TaxID=2498858 RepID=A0A3S0ZG94_9GAMM|nr:host specificity factor TipJ family phage tail protein [Halomonas populi]RUR48782.1 hypothetical protein ELY37_02730 [Halomonas populi]